MHEFGFNLRHYRLGRQQQTQGQRRTEIEALGDSINQYWIVFKFGPLPLATDILRLQMD